LSRRKRVRERRGDETVYLETFALLMKEVAIREYRGGYGGVSSRIAKGVRYSPGRTRGDLSWSGPSFKKLTVASSPSRRSECLPRWQENDGVPLPEADG
jgi:hypothetical protein